MDLILVVVNSAGMAENSQNGVSRQNGVSVPLGRTHYMRSSFIYRCSLAWNALLNDVTISVSLSAFKINL